MEQPAQKANHAEIGQALLALIPAKIGYGCCSELDCQALLAQEQPYASTIKSSKRFKEYSLGRTAARLALKKLATVDLQYESHPLLKLDSGIVDWPIGVTGSISHCGEVGIAAIAKTTDYYSLGLDFECYRSVADKVIARIASKQEMQVLLSINPSVDKNFFSIFSAKEAIFKALFPLVNKRFGFSAVSLVKIKQGKHLAQDKFICELEFVLEDALSMDFTSGSTLNVLLFCGETFSLTLSAIPVLLS